MKRIPIHTSGRNLAAAALVLIAPSMAPALGPEITSWYTVNANVFATVVEVTGGSAITTWPTVGRPNTGGGVSVPTKSDVQQIRYSVTYSYINANGLASYTMGPWYSDVAKTVIFGNWPSNQNVLARFPRTPVPASGSHTQVGLGPQGLMSDGVALFNSLDAFSYKNSGGSDQPGAGGDDYWHRLAIEEVPSFDPANAHQPTSGQYHYHTNPYGLRYQLNDNINLAGGVYSENFASPHHSPILGYAFDGYPVYGPYGYSTANNSSSGIRRMTSGYVLRNGTNSTTNLTSTGRHTLPQWSATTYSHSTTLIASQYGPNVSPSFALGRYAEDYDYLGDHAFVQGTDFDLDQYNGRTCVTPEYPGGIYAYFVAMDASGNPSYPYMLGSQFYGVKSGGTVASISESVTTYFPSAPVVDWEMFN